MSTMLGDYIRAKREDRDFTVRGFAKQAKVSHPYLSQVETGDKTPSSKWLAKIAPVLRVDMHDLLVLAGYLKDAEGVAKSPEDYIVYAESEAERQHLEKYKAFIRSQGGDNDNK